MTDVLVLSRHVSFLAIDADHFLCGHAFAGPRDLVDTAQRAHLEAFRQPTELDDYLRRLPDPERAQLSARIAVWRRHGLLVDVAGDEDAALQRAFGAHVETVRDGIRRAQMRSRHDPRWRLRIGEAPAVAAPRASWKVVYLGACLLLPGLDAVIELAARQGYAIHGAGSFAHDHRLIDDEQPDVIVLGDLPRVGFARGDLRPVQYVAAMRAALAEIRRRTAAPILIRNLIVPTCSLAGIADRGAASHVNKARAVNVALAELADELDEVYVVDVDQALALTGKRGLVDDMVVLSHHLGSLTWLVERAEREPITEPGGPDLAALLRDASGRARLEAEYVIAAEDLRVMCAVRGHGLRKLVVVDLDGTLWPGLIAETGAPFPPGLTVDVYPHHLYLGLHEALLALRDRGILLACVSKNDPDVVRSLWRYPPELDGVPRLALTDFVTHRIDWGDKADHLCAIADELGVGLDRVAFIDDSPHERASVRARLPEVMVLGDNPFEVRWQLLTDPAFQVPRITGEARRRSELVRGQLARAHDRRTAPDPAAFRTGLALHATLRRETDHRHRARIVELLRRTTQLNTTGEQPSLADLDACTIYTLAAADRFGDHGLVGVCIADGAVIRQLVVSCRVLGLGLDDLLVCAAARDIARRTGASRVAGRVIATPRNHPARSVFARCGFARDPVDPERWWIDRAALAAPELPYAVEYDGFAG